MRRIMLVFTVALVMAAMMGAMGAQAIAKKHVGTTTQPAPLHQVARLSLTTGRW